MWLFKAKFAESIPYPIVAKISVGNDKFFDVNSAQIVFAFAHDYTTGAYGGSVSEGRVQVVIYKTIKGNYVLVPQDIALWPRETLIGHMLNEIELKHTYHEIKQRMELGVDNTIILVDTLQYKRSEV